MKGKLFFALVVLALGFLGYRILAGASPEKQARAAYHALEKAFEARSVVRLRLALDDTFSVDGLGRLDESLARCQYFFNLNRSVNVTSQVRVANSNPDLIELSVEAQVAGTTSEGNRWRGLSDEFDSFCFTLIVRKKHNRWTPCRLIPNEQARKAIESFGGVI